MLVRLRAWGGGVSWLTPKLPRMYLDRHPNLNARETLADYQSHDDEVTDIEGGGNWGPKAGPCLVDL